MSTTTLLTDSKIYVIHCIPDTTPGVELWLSKTSRHFRFACLLLLQYMLLYTIFTCTRIFFLFLIITETYPIVYNCTSLVHNNYFYF